MLQIELDFIPKTRPTIIEGFPGFGFVSTIATEFLIKHLNAKPIGRICSEKIQPVAAIHKSEVINPLGIFYDKKHNIMIIQAVIPVDGLEWDLAATIAELAKRVKAKEIIGLEGVSSPGVIKNPQVFFYSKAPSKMLKSLKLNPLQEGLIIGVTGALLVKEKVPLSCFFVETQSKMPDNNGAAKLIQTLDNYLSLKVDAKPLIDKAKEFETKLKGLMTGLSEVKAQKEAKNLSYID
ncbi:MAG: PAC2 family protein [archaeon]